MLHDCSIREYQSGLLNILDRRTAYMIHRRLGTHSYVAVVGIVNLGISRLRHAMKVSRQESFVASCTHRYLQNTFVESHILSLKSLFEQHHLELSYYKVSQICINCKTFSSRLGVHRILGN